MESEMGRKILLIVAKRGYTGADREVFFHNIRGIRYSDLEREVLALEDAGYITIEWVGPSNFTVMITPKGVELVKTYAEDVWHKDVKALEELDRAKHVKKSVHTQKIDYERMMGDKIHVAEVGNLPTEIIESIDEQIIAERGAPEKAVETGAVGVPAVEEQILENPTSDEKGIKIKQVSGEIESEITEGGETITISSSDALLEDPREARIAVDKATKLERRVKEKRISGEIGEGEDSKPLKARTKRRKSKPPVDEMEEESMEESVLDEDAVSQDNPPDFYQQIEEALNYGESILERERLADDVDVQSIFEEMGCLWEPAKDCHMMKSGAFGDIESPTLNHCILCLLLEIKELIKK